MASELAGRVSLPGVEVLCQFHQPDLSLPCHPHLSAACQTAFHTWNMKECGVYFECLKLHRRPRIGVTRNPCCFCLWFVFGTWTIPLLCIFGPLAVFYLHDQLYSTGSPPQESPRSIPS
ncbi:uncharacterized protein BO88DRAFT_78731 [Aspergillus vadensis CBS 113365]|uniref:Uncharacterized protein n=1 Tax=Aspergillus vadensis (strain CBS 113365 / IMI 142717 / IBT 24658) TaxID=1448311 RepID=A0A319B398_ASPVC|nr:hypothetical protein BO88DRAFT_78731 [Aspergillus vadensis CBS 113365]PYH67246.1 hypothetical protein BO88DRAFT_78731 [Aspergillus vadensis CBS 113365]